MLRQLAIFAIYFSVLLAKPANAGVGELASIGREIYLEGIPEINIVPCAACHGPTPRVFASFLASEDFRTLT
jgi:hypothetical protein